MFLACDFQPRNVNYFKETEAFELARSVGNNNAEHIKKIVQADPGLMEITNPVSGSNVLSLALFLENYESFKTLLELGADPNFINPYSKHSVLIDACKIYRNYAIDLRYIELLLASGADPNYTVHNRHTDEKGRSYWPTSPLIRASKLDLEMVKLLINAGADPHKRLEYDNSTTFTASLTGFKNKFEIINYYIDSIGVDVFEPLAVVTRRPGNEVVKYYIQDFIDRYPYKPGTESYIKKQELISKLENMGVNFDENR